MLKVFARFVNNKPNEIPLSQWLIQDKEYTVIAICQSKMTGDMYYKLEEVSPPAPYGGYNISRFEMNLDSVLQTVELDIIQIP